VIARVIKDECVNESKTQHVFHLKKSVCLQKETKLKPTFFDFLQSAKISPYKKQGMTGKKLPLLISPPIFWEKYKFFV